MRKSMVTVYLFFVLFAFAVSGAMAQTTWTWSDPITVTTLVKEMAGDPKSDAIYGIEKVSGAVSPLATGGTLPGSAATGTPFTEAKDLVVGFGGLVYVISDDTVATASASPYAPIAGQPKTPAGKEGSFTHIASGNNGKLYVLFETTGESEQYLLVGNSPVQNTLVVKLNPQSLNLGSKGNWVTCLIEIPGYDIKGIDPASVKVTQFVIDGNPVDVDIPVDPSAPYDFGTNKLMVKFKRYNKANGDDPASFVGALSGELPPGPSKGTVPVQATIQAEHGEAGLVSGVAEFRVIVPKAKTKKQK